MEITKEYLETCINNYILKGLEDLKNGTITELEIPFSSVDKLGRIFDKLGLKHEYHCCETNGCDYDWSFDFVMDNKQFETWGSLTSGYIGIEFKGLLEKHSDYKKHYSDFSTIPVYDSSSMSILVDCTHIGIDCNFPKTKIKEASIGEIVALRKKVKEFESDYEIDVVYNKQFEYHHTAILNFPQPDRFEDEECADIVDELTDKLDTFLTENNIYLG